MAFLALPLVMPLISTSYSTQNFSYSQFAPYMRRTRIAKNGAFLIKANADSAQDDKPTKLVTFLGKGGSGKTTSAIFAAQHYAKAGLNTCLVIHSQDPTADYLLNRKIGTKPITCNNNFSAVRLETTKMLLEPLNKLKEADSRLNMTQGVLEGVVGEELGVLPGMDSIFSAFALERFLKFFGNKPQGKDQKDKFDVVIYDGISTEETLRMIGATSKSRLYLKYIRNLSEKTDLGRLAGPSLMRLLDEALNITGRRSNPNGTLSSEIWNYLEQTLEKGSLIFTEPSKFSCYLVMDPNNTLSINSALRYWGCAIQAGAIVSGAVSIGSKMEFVKSTFTPLRSAFIPHLASNFDTEEVREVRRLLTNDDKMTIPPSVEFDSVKKSVTLLMPGFDKSEIKLYQFRGGSELLVEAGDQRRVIRLPSQIQGKVSGAKFIERNLVITMR